MLIRKATPIVVAVTALALAQACRAQDAGEIRGWIQQLGSPKFAERVQAERRLAQSDRAVAFVKQALVSDLTPEARRRCSRLLADRRSAMVDDVARELDRMARRGEYARGTATAVAWRYDLREKVRDYQTAAVESLAADVRQKTGRATFTPKLKNAREVVLENARATRCVVHKLFAVRELDFGNACTCGLLVSGSLRTTASVNNCVAFVNGPVALRHITNSVVFVGGDLSLEDADQSLIVCTGAVQSEHGFDNSTVVCGGAIRAPAGNSPNSLLRAKAKDLADLVRPWTAAELGVEPAADAGRVRAGTVAPKSPMSAAGVETGDILLSVDDETIVTCDDALKTLRRKSVEFLPFVVRVKRGERELELVVPWSAPTTPR
jgi:hypothetical protein